VGVSSNLYLSRGESVLCGQKCINCLKHVGEGTGAALHFADDLRPGENTGPQGAMPGLSSDGHPATASQPQGRSDVLRLGRGGNGSERERDSREGGGKRRSKLPLSDIATVRA